MGPNAPRWVQFNLVKSDIHENLAFFDTYCTMPSYLAELPALPGPRTKFAQLLSIEGSNPVVPRPYSECENKQELRFEPSYPSLILTLHNVST